MRKIRLLLSAFVVSMLTVAALAMPASATPNTKLDLVQDCSTNCPEPVDMQGPTGFGFINYNQDSEGNLRAVTSLKNADPNTTYHIFLVCGPTHATACGFIDIGTLTTDDQGNGNSGAIVIPVGTLQTAPFGSGARTDHIDLIGGAGNLSNGVYATSNVNYMIP
jgi:hypothetical protein